MVWGESMNPLSSSSTPDVPMIDAYEDLLQLLAAGNVPHEAHRKDEMVEIPIEKGELDSVLVMRWQADRVIQFIALLPFEVPVGRQDVMFRALMLLNHGLIIQGFGLDFGARRVYFRLTLPVRPGGVTGPEVTAMFRASVRLAAQYHPVLQAIALHGAEPQSVLGAPPVA